MVTNLLNIKFEYNDAYVLKNTSATFEAGSNYEKVKQH